MVYSSEEISIQLNRWVLLVITFFGIFGNIVNITVFIRPVFNHHVCSWYFFALAMNNCIYSFIVLMYRLLTDGFQISAMINSLSLCQFISYITIFCTNLSHYLIVLVAINRYSASSANPRRRKFNSFQIMSWSILLMIIFSALLAISNSIVIDLKSSDGLSCRIQVTTAYNEFYVILQLILFAILAPILMVTFALLTFRNRTMIGDIPMAVSKCRHMEHHQTGMFFLLVVAHVVLNVFQWIDYLILLRPNLFESSSLLPTIIRMPIYLSYVFPMVCYLITGPEFRRELRKMFPILALFCRNNQVALEVNDNPEIHH